MWAGTSTGRALLLDPKVGATEPAFVLPGVPSFSFSFHSRSHLLCLPYSSQQWYTRHTNPQIPLIGFTERSS